MEIIDGKKISAQVKQELADEIATFVAEGKKIPHLVAVLVGNDGASETYVASKVKACQAVGMKSSELRYGDDITEEQLLAVIDKLNDDPDVDGFIVQLPLPKHISEEKILNRINPDKDVDGFHPMSSCVACTPKGIIDYLEFLKYDFVDKNALIIGRSNIVGRPLAKILLDKSANVTVIHSKTSKENKEKFLKMADLIIVAVGKKYFLNENYLKSNAYIIDVGINRIDGKLYGDVIPNLNVSLQTPVPGGVGLLTRLSLLENLLLCYKERRGKNNAI